MAKKKCFICGKSVGMEPKALTKDSYYVCYRDAKLLCPQSHSDLLYIGSKAAKFINTHTAAEISQQPEITVVTDYLDNPAEYQSKISKKLNEIVENGNAASQQQEQQVQANEAEQQQRLQVIEEQLQEAGATDFFGTKKEVRQLPDIIDIDGGEQIRFAASGIVEGNTVLVVCTNRRVLFIDSGMIFGRKSSEIPLDSINATSYSKGLVLGSISVTNGAKTTVIESLQKDDAVKLNSVLQQVTAEFKNQLHNATTAAPTSDLSQLRELKGLLDDGIITQDEFDAKKKQILGI